MTLRMTAEKTEFLQRDFPQTTWCGVLDEGQILANWDN